MLPITTRVSSCSLSFLPIAYPCHSSPDRSPGKNESADEHQPLSLQEISFPSSNRFELVRVIRTNAWSTIYWRAPFEKSYSFIRNEQPATSQQLCEWHRCSLFANISEIRIYGFTSFHASFSKRPETKFQLRSISSIERMNSQREGFRRAGSFADDARFFVLVGYAIEGRICVAYT